MKEQRRYHRMIVPVPLSFKPETSDKPVQTYTLDISGTGFCFKTTEELKVKDVLTFRMQLEKMKSIEIDGEVRWVRQKFKGEHQQFLVGVKVVDEINQEKLKYLRFIVSKMYKFFTPKDKP